MVLDTVRDRVFPSPDQVSRFQAVARQFLLAKALRVSLWRNFCTKRDTFYGTSYLKAHLLGNRCPK
ncbi:hypothetical protein E2C01_060833 [Portunus trituberculatus]|uniref:Uncharacterized protein n=1 Tax=Portunus trituberculatus TaxID=210409 RepID=A0A5B7H6K3_PORTR|nr:hypothetical protein [Portunus trituberculatus]